MTDDGHHHHPERDDISPDHDPATSLRFRLYVGGKLQQTQWIDALDPHADDVAEVTTMLHAKAARAAEAGGLAWIVEVYDPTAQPEVAYLRFGTDLAGMQEPRPVSMIWGTGDGGVTLGARPINGDAS